MRVLGLLAIAVAMHAQSLRLSSAAAAPGEQVTVGLSLDSAQQDVRPVALQWEMTFPAQFLEIQSNGLQASPAAIEAGKSMKCVQRSPYVHACLLAGGQKPLPSGLIANFEFKVSAKAAGRKAVVQIQKAQAATLDLKQLTFDEVTGTITVH